MRSFLPLLIVLLAFTVILHYTSATTIQLGPDEIHDATYGIIYSIHDSEEALWSKRALAASEKGLPIPEGRPIEHLLARAPPTLDPVCKKYEKKAKCMWIKHDNGKIRCFRGLHGEGEKDYKGRECVCACASDSFYCSSYCKNDLTEHCLNWADCEGWDKVSKETCQNLTNTFTECVKPCGPKATTTTGATTGTKTTTGTPSATTGGYYEGYYPYDSTTTTTGGAGYTTPASSTSGTTTGYPHATTTVYYSPPPSPTPSTTVATQRPNSFSTDPYSSDAN